MHSANAQRIYRLFQGPSRPSSNSDLQIVALDGRSGSGKTTLATTIAGLHPEVLVISLENFYAGWDGLETGPSRLVQQVLRPWASGLPARARYWDWHRNQWAKELTDIPMPDSRRVLIEGCGASSIEIAPFTSALVWLRASSERRYRQAMDREGEIFGPYWQMWAEQEREFLEKNQPLQRADLLLDT